MRQHAAEAAAAFTARLPEVAALIDNLPVYGYTGHIAVSHVPAQGATCRHCGAPVVPDRLGWIGWRDANGSPQCPASRAHSHEPETEARTG
jgi:hypothetical protein